MKKYSFYIAGGDLRSAYLAAALAEGKNKVAAFGLSGADEILKGVFKSESLSDAAGFDAADLPLPCCDGEGYIKTPLSDKKVKLEELINSLEHGSVLMGGFVPDWVYKLAEKRQIAVYDYYEREEFAVRNAALTAEAAVALAMELLTETISDMPVLVLGHGRIGRLLASILKALDAKVTVAARRFSDLAWIRSEGLVPIEFMRLKEHISEFGVIFNTVPAMVLDGELLSMTDKKAVIIDLASEPCGTDFAAAERLGLKVRKAPGLPGKFAPKTAGEIIKDTVLNILSEREEDSCG